MTGLKGGSNGKEEYGEGTLSYNFCTGSKQDISITYTTLRYKVIKFLLRLFTIQLVQKYTKNSAKPFQHLTTLQQY